MKLADLVAAGGYVACTAEHIGVISGTRYTAQREPPSVAPEVLTRLSRDPAVSVRRLDACLGSSLAYGKGPKTPR
jgi:hypothetical protein